VTELKSAKAGVEARVGVGTTWGESCVFGANVVLGKNCRIGNHVVFHDDTVIGDGVRIDDQAVLGKLPMRAASSATTKDAQLEPLKVGDGSIVGTGVVLYRGLALGRKCLVADLATVREDVTIGDRTIVGRGVTVENECTIGKFVKLESECYITAYSTIEDRVFIAPGVITSNDNFVGRTEVRKKHFKGITVKKGARVGAGSVILPGKTIGEDALVAAGSVVTKDVPARKVVMGSPARVVRDVPTEQLLEHQGWSDEV
jgi:UDP-2-acetamido-3-amino-2,3-dideoxy-glucuronate N-acetyltransferase